MLRHDPLCVEKIINNRSQVDVTVLTDGIVGSGIVGQVLGLGWELVSLESI
jgi:hypothetical protein